MKKLIKRKEEIKKEEQPQVKVLKGSVDYLSDYFCSYLSTLEVVNTRH